MGHASGLSRLLFGARQRRTEQARQNRDDGDDDKQFDERETATASNRRVGFEAKRVDSLHVRVNGGRLIGAMLIRTGILRAPFSQSHPHALVSAATTINEHESRNCAKIVSRILTR